MSLLITRGLGPAKEDEAQPGPSVKAPRMERAKDLRPKSKTAHDLKPRMSSAKEEGE